MGEKITSKHFTIKRTIEGKNSTVDFVPKVKTHTMPEIADSYVDDDTGDVIHILANGNKMSQLDYERQWGKPLIKGTVNWDAKPEKIGGRKIV